MQEIVPNPWALAACVAIRLAVGALWYSPLLFLKPWLKASGVSEASLSKGMLKAILSDLVLSLIMAFVLLHAIRYALAPGSRDLPEGLAVAFLNWLGFVAPVHLGLLTYEHKPLRYFLIVSGYQLVTLLAMGAVLTLWG
jgi:vacuolar-type H+-ATPase subunit I/STV1